MDAILVNYYSCVRYANLKLQFSKLGRNMRFLLNITYPLPPHIQVLNDNSRFSPPQMSKPLSYVPIRSKKARSIEKRPPAIVGDQTGSAGFLCLFFSLSGTACQLNLLTNINIHQEFVYADGLMKLWQFKKIAIR